MIDDITGAPVPNYHYAETIVAVTPSHYAVKVFAEKGGSYGVNDYMGFGNFILTIEPGLKTRAFIAGNLEYRSSKHSAEEILAMIETTSVEVDKKIPGYWENLLKLIESKSRV